MSGDEEAIAQERAGEIDQRVEEARHSVQAGLDPDPPDLRVIRERLQRRHRRVAVAAAVSVVVLAVGVGVVAAGDGPDGEQRVIAASDAASSSTTPPALSIEPDTQWDGAMLLEDGRTLQISVGVSPPGDGPCNQNFDHEVLETESQVVVAVEEQPAPSASGDVACTDLAQPQSIEVTLDQPLGKRELYDGVQDSPQPVWDRSELVDVTYLPDGFSPAEVYPEPATPKHYWQRIYQADGADWYFSVTQRKAGEFKPYGDELGPVTVHGIEGERYGYMNGTMLTIHWVEGGLDIEVWGEMQGPPTFTHEEELLRIAEGVRLPD